MDYQPYPTKGQLASNINLELASLKRKIHIEQADVFCYVVATIKNRNGQLFQTGSAPNFQGDLVSLCTCKHLMRTAMDPEEWVGKWIAGFSSLAAGNRANVLVYLMKVGFSFNSQQSLWLSDEIAEEAKQAKLANTSQFGDIYQPKNQISDPFSFQSYLYPVENHVHCENNNWQKDINYEGYKGRGAALLIGDPSYSFLWNKPMIFRKGTLGRGYNKKDNLQALLDERLEELKR